jgi:four helix bundle protein
MVSGSSLRSRVLWIVVRSSSPVSLSSGERRRAMTNWTTIPHENLIAYQVAKELLRLIRDANIKDAKLRDQALRAAKSACLNIAEAAGRFSAADKARVFAIARGEACEALAAVDIAAVAADCAESAASDAAAAARRLYALLTGLIRK